MRPDDFIEIRDSLGNLGAALTGLIDSHPENMDVYKVILMDVGHIETTLLYNTVFDKED